MKTFNKITLSVATVLGLSLTIAPVYAQQGPMGGSGYMGNGVGPGGMHGGVTQGQMMGQNANVTIMRELMSPAERLAMMDQMIDAKTVSERQEIMIKNHAEMEKRAKEKGITLPSGYGPQMMFGTGCR